MIIKLAFSISFFSVKDAQVGNTKYYKQKMRKKVTSGSNFMKYL